MLRASSNSQVPLARAVPNSDVAATDALASKAASMLHTASLLRWATGTLAGSTLNNWAAKA